MRQSFSPYSIRFNCLRITQGTFSWRLLLLARRAVPGPVPLLYPGRRPFNRGYSIAANIQLLPFRWRFLADALPPIPSPPLSWSNPQAVTRPRFTFDRYQTVPPLKDFLVSLVENGRIERRSSLFPTYVKGFNSFRLQPPPPIPQLTPGLVF